MVRAVDIASHTSDVGPVTAASSPSLVSVGA
jgi:hypothetical protein